MRLLLVIHLLTHLRMNLLRKALHFTQKLLFPLENWISCRLKSKTCCIVH